MWFLKVESCVRANDFQLISIYLFSIFIRLCFKFLDLLLFLINMCLYKNDICICMFRSGYSVLLCCSVYFLCANVYRTTATDVNTTAVNKYITSYLIYIQTTHKPVSLFSNFVRVYYLNIVPLDRNML